MIFKNSSKALVVVGSIFIGTSCVSQLRSNTATDTLGANVVSEPSFKSSGPHLGDMSWGLTVWKPDDFYQQKLSVENYQTVIVREWTADPVDGTESSIQHLGTSSFYIHALASARRNLFAFGGRSRNGELVVEAWELLDEVDLSASGSGFGVLSQEYSFTPLVPRRFRKVEMFRGPSEPLLYDMEYDPQGRFILLLLGDDQSRMLYKLETDGSGVLSVVANSVTTPELVEMYSIQKFDQDALGRVYALNDDAIPYAMQILITDSDNDGQFDPFPLIGDFAFFTSIGLEDYFSWNPLIGY